jgi:methionyl-tRNA formyltransferase
MGTPIFAVPSLKILLDEKYDVAAVVTQPDKPKGRGKKVMYSKVKEYAIENNLTVMQPEKVKNNGEFIEQIRLLKPDIFVTAAYGKILPKELLEIPRYGCINVHASLLPKYRGAAPIHWAIINGEQTTGVTTMMTDMGMDTGDILLKKEIKIDKTYTTGILHDKLSVIGAELLSETLLKLKEGSLERIPQYNGAATYAPIMTKDFGRINWNKKADEIFNLIRGTNPWPVAFTYHKGERMKIWNAVAEKSDFTSGKPGTIVGVNKKGISVATADGTMVRILEVQFDSCRRMCVEQYVCGHEMLEGDVFE